MTKQIEKSLLDLDFTELRRRKFTPSPAAWEDQVTFRDTRRKRRSEN